MSDSIQPPVHENTSVSPGISTRPTHKPPCPKARMASFSRFPEAPRC